MLKLLFLAPANHNVKGSHELLAVINYGELRKKLGGCKYFTTLYGNNHNNYSLRHEIRLIAQYSLNQSEVDWIERLLLTR